jgi:aminoglycoside 3-N-acetyltransferase I
MKLELKVLTKTDLEDFKTLISVFADVFEFENFSMPNSDYLEKLLNQDNFFPVVAKHEQKIVGGLTVYIFTQYYSTKPLAYIYDLAVLNELQRKGIGKQLIDFTNKYCSEKGFEEVFVQAETADDYAVDFYRKTKPTGELGVAHFFYKL